RRQPGAAGGEELADLLVGVHVPSPYARRASPWRYCRYPYHPCLPLGAAARFHTAMTNSLLSDRGAGLAPELLALSPIGGKRRPVKVVEHPAFAPRRLRAEALHAA